jgi:hypothetical protein
MGKIRTIRDCSPEELRRLAAQSEGEFREMDRLAGLSLDDRDQRMVTHHVRDILKKVFRKR